MSTSQQMDPRPLRVALLGCGHIGQDVYLPLLRNRRDAAIAVVADTSATARARASALTRNLVTVVGDWQDALQRDRVDAAIVALPPPLHAEAARSALMRGLHVYVEKPVATKLADADEVIAAHRAAASFAAVGFNYRFNPLYRELGSVVRNGGIGRLRLLRTVFASPRRSAPAWRDSRSTGGGVLLELGSHHADLIRWLTGAEATTVQCLAADGDRGDAVASVNFSLDNGATAQMLVVFGTIADDRVEVVGDRGAAMVNRYRSLAVELRDSEVPGRLDALSTLWRSLPRLPYLVRKMRSPWHEPSHGAAVDAFLAGARGAVGEAPTLEDGRASLRIVLAAEESAVTGRAVVLGR